VSLSSLGKWIFIPFDIATRQSIINSIDFSLTLGRTKARDALMSILSRDDGLEGCKERMDEKKREFSQRGICEYFGDKM
jgi:hypothetical protein